MYYFKEGSYWRVAARRVPQSLHWEQKDVSAIGFDNILINHTKNQGPKSGLDSFSLITRKFSFKSMAMVPVLEY